MLQVSDVMSCMLTDGVEGECQYDVCVSYWHRHIHIYHIGIYIPYWHVCVCVCCLCLLTTLIKYFFLFFMYLCEYGMFACVLILEEVCSWAWCVDA